MIWGLTPVRVLRSRTPLITITVNGVQTAGSKLKFRIKYAGLEFMGVLNVIKLLFMFKN